MNPKQKLSMVPAGGSRPHTMYYADEIRDVPDTSVQSSSVSEKELRFAEAFINALAGPFRSENFRDEYRAGLRSLIVANCAQMN
jgi:DNA end-binding protein Ku